MGEEMSEYEYYLDRLYRRAIQLRQLGAFRWQVVEQLGREFPETQEMLRKIVDEVYKIVPYEPENYSRVRRYKRKA